MPKSPELDELFRTQIEDALTNARVPGACLVLLLDGEPVYAAGVGFSDLERTEPLRVDARFYIYSTTKSLIAATILRLAEEERLALEHPVQHYLPGLALESPVSLRQLLNHTGGIRDYGAMEEYFTDLKTHPRRPWSSREFLERVLASGPAFSAGVGWRYSNIGYLMLRGVIETVAQCSLRAALARYVFEPLGLPLAQVAEDLESAQQLTPGFSAVLSPDGALRDIRADYHPGWVSHGVVTASPFELARFYDALLTGRLLRPESLEVMLEAVRVPFRHPLFADPAYGLGLMIDLGSPFGLVAGHGGGGPGYSAGALHFPQMHGHRLTSVALVNSDQGDLGLPLAYNLAMSAAAVLENTGFI